MQLLIQSSACTIICECTCTCMHMQYNKCSDWRSLVPEPLLSSVVEYLCVAWLQSSNGIWFSYTRYGQLIAQLKGFVKMSWNNRTSEIKKSTLDKKKSTHEKSTQYHAPFIELLFWDVVLCVFLMCGLSLYTNVDFFFHVLLWTFFCAFHQVTNLMASKFTLSTLFSLKGQTHHWKTS